jgi:hypothetical protein
LKLRIFIFLFAILAAGLVAAEENDALSSRRFGTADADFNFAYSNDQMSKHAIGERSIDLFGSSGSSDSGKSSRYNVELALENEDSDWSFEVTVTVEF